MSKELVLQRVRQNLFSQRSVEHPFHQGITEIADGLTTTITVDDGSVWESGDILEVVDTGEQCYVSSVSTNDLTVIRGFNGTTASTSGSATLLCRKNPQFTVQEIEDQYDRVLASLWGHGIFAWTTTSLNIAASDTTPWLIQLTNTVTPRTQDVISVVATSTLDNSPEVHVPFRVRGVNTQVEVTIPDPGNLDYDSNLYVHWVQPITDIDTDETHPDVEQILEDGVTYRLMASSMNSRLHDPGQLTDRTVQPGQGGRDARFYQGEFVLGVRRVAQEMKVEKANRRVGQDYGSSRRRRWRV